MVTGDSQEEVIIFRDKQTDMHHNIYIVIVIFVNVVTVIIVIIRHIRKGELLLV